MAFMKVGGVGVLGTKLEFIAEVSFPQEQRMVVPARSAQFIDTMASVASRWVLKRMKA